MLEIFLMEKCISVPHDTKTNFCFPSHEKTNILTEEGSEIFFTSTMKIPAPRQENGCCLRALGSVASLLISPSIKGIMI